MRYIVLYFLMLILICFMSNPKEDFVSKELTHYSYLDYEADMYFDNLK